MKLPDIFEKLLLSDVVFLTCAANGQIVYISGNVEKIYQQPVNEFIGNNISRYIVSGYSKLIENTTKSNHQPSGTSFNVQLKINENLFNAIVSVLYDQDKDEYSYFLVNQPSSHNHSEKAAIKWLQSIAEDMNQELDEKTILQNMLSHVPSCFPVPSDVRLKINYNEEQFTNYKSDEVGYEFCVKSYFGTLQGEIEIYVETAQNINFISRFENETLSIALNIIIIYFQKQDAERQLKVSQSKFSELFSNVPDIVFNLDREGKILKINPAATKLLGYHDLEGQNFFDYVVPSQRIDIFSHIKEVLEENGSSFSVETGLLSERGEIIYCQIKGEVKYLKSGQPAEIFGVARDITQQRIFDQNMLKAIINTQENERKRFAKDLHDGLGPLLSGVKLYLQKDSLEKNLNQQQLNVLQFSRELIDEAISQTRSIANNLTPGLINDFGLQKAIESYIDRINAIGKLEIDLIIKASLEGIGNDLAIAVHRILSELINNALKHSQSTRVEIVLDIRNNILSVLYHDNGKGFDPSEIKKHDLTEAMGINNIYNRVHSFHGSITISTKNGSGVNIKIYFPLNSLKK
jgi:PAS domain S-box-containing protein